MKWSKSLVCLQINHKNKSKEWIFQVFKIVWMSAWVLKLKTLHFGCFANGCCLFQLWCNWAQLCRQIIEIRPNCSFIKLKNSKRFLHFRECTFLWDREYWENGIPAISFLSSRRYSVRALSCCLPKDIDPPKQVTCQEALTTVQSPKQPHPINMLCLVSRNRHLGEELWLYLGIARFS